MTVPWLQGAPGDTRDILPMVAWQIHTMDWKEQGAIYPLTAPTDRFVRQDGTNPPEVPPCRRSQFAE
ncbi:hypothetical protein BgiBS90_004627 [Biomphalaria glabrata]|nr:hypothetical protein BgiBS90_004627 [Biomphalaria glabrata]